MFGQFRLLEGAATAIAESGTIVFTNEFNTAPKKKNVPKQQEFDDNTTIYGTLYMKQKMYRIPRDNKTGTKIYITIVLMSDDSKYITLALPVAETENENRHWCFEIAPEQLNVKDDNHFALLEFLKNLENTKHELLVYLTHKEGVRGKMTLDLSAGKGRYQAVFDELEKEQQRIAAEKEAARIIAQEAAERQRIITQKKIAVYEGSTDFVYVTLKNNAYTALSGHLSTGYGPTDNYFEIEPNQTLKIRCRPNEKIYIDQQIVLTVNTNSNGKVLDVTPSPIAIRLVKTQWSGDDAWKEWAFRLDENKSWTMKTQWSGDDAWKEWNIKTGNETWSVKTQWSGDDAWKEWVFKTKAENMTLKTVWSGDEAWKEWQVNSSKYGNVSVKTQWSGDDAWKEWSISSKYGTMTVKTAWSGDDAWKEWTITDNMKTAPPQLRSAAIFCCLLSAILPQTASMKNPFCSFDGKQLFGKVKFVDSYEDIKIKYVDSNEDIKVEFVNSSPNDCGEWQEVTSYEDIKVKVVTSGEDIKVKKVTSSPGMK